jgi:hypothetical protein
MIEAQAEHPVEPLVDTPREVSAEMRVGVVVGKAVDATGEVPFEEPDRTRAEEVPVDPDILALPVGALVAVPADLSVAGLGEIPGVTTR